jgi:hypothetical protein
VWGITETKYAWLEAHDLENTEWETLKPGSPDYFFVPGDELLRAKYICFPSVPEVFPVNSVGIVTARDGLTIQWKPEDVWTTVRAFSEMEPELAREGYKLGKDARDWKVTLAQRDLRDSGPSRDKIARVLYRPWDVRYTYYTGRSRGFICMPRPEVMRHMMAGENLALITPKQHKDEFGAMVTNTIGTHKSVAAYDINYYFPLYLYPSAANDDLYETRGRRPNLNGTLVAALTEAYGCRPTPEEIIYYVYAVLYSSVYRERYAQFLRRDFARVPFAADAGLFRRLCDLGSRLAALHLLKSSELDPPACVFDGRGDSCVAKGTRSGVRYDPGEERVYINATQYFAPVPENVWTYRVGGYQVCEKWLKDRREHRLDDIRTYCGIVTALKLTLGIQKEIDELYPSVEIRSLDLSGCM